MRKLIIQLWYWLPPLALMSIIFYLSAQPDLPHTPVYWLDLLIKKLGHATEYAILFLLLFRTWHHDYPLAQALRTSLLITAVYAISDELHQAFVPGRHANWYDVLIDLSATPVLWRILCHNGRLSIPRGQDKDLTE